MPTTDMNTNANKRPTLIEEQEPSCIGYLTLTLRGHRCGSQRVLSHPVVHGTLKGGDRVVTMDNPFALGQMARLGGFDSIELVSTPYVGWSVPVETLRNAEMRCMLESWDAKFLTALRDGFNSCSTRKRLASRESAARLEAAA